MAKKDYSKISKKIIELIGGKENVSHFMHCVTRLRFNVKDKGLVNDDEIKSIREVLGTQWIGDQYQIVIGNHVSDLYNVICEENSFEKQDGINENLDKKKKRINFSSIIDVVAGSVSSMLPIIIGCSFIKILVMIFDLAGMDSSSGTYQVMTFVGDAGFYFMPIYVGGFTAKKLNCSVALGMLLGAILIHPTLIASINEGNQLNVFGINFEMINYSSGFLPALMSVCVMAPVQKFFERYSPKSLRAITVPFLTLMVMVPLILIVIGPLGTIIGNYLGDALIWIYETLDFVGVAIMAAIAPLVIATGMHTTLVAYAITLYMELGYEPLVFVTGIIACLAQGAASLGVYIKSKNPEIKSNALACFITATAGGISEPSLFGISLKYRTPLYAALAGGAIGGAVAGLGKVKIYALASSSVYNIIACLPGGTNNFIWMAAACIIGFLASLFFCLAFYKDVE